MGGPGLSLVITEGVGGCGQGVGLCTEGEGMGRNSMGAGVEKKAWYGRRSTISRWHDGGRRGSSSHVQCSAEEAFGLGLQGCAQGREKGHGCAHGLEMDEESAKE